MLKKLLIAIVCLVALVATFVAGVGIFVKVKYDVNILTVIPQIKKVNKIVDESVYTEKFTDADLESAKLVLNAEFGNLISYSVTNGYDIESSGLSSLSNDIKLTNKQVGAVLKLFIEKNGGTSINIGGNNIPNEILQIDFNNITSDSVDFNIVIKLDIAEIKNQMGGVLSIVSKYVPQYLYISSNVTISKDRTSPFVYTVSHKDVSINNLTSEETINFIKILNIVINIGEIEDFNVIIGSSYINALIGDNQNTGLVYSLRSLGVSDYDFTMEGDLKYFVIKN